MCTCAIGRGTRNRAAAKTKPGWSIEGRAVRGGVIKRVSPAMIHTYFEYVTSEYPRPDPGHGMLLVQLRGPGSGQPWATDAARRMLRRAGQRAGLGLIRPHAFRDASGGNLLIARDAGGWASATIVEEIYAHADVHDPVFDAALRAVWGQEQ